jgi:magnesium-transporting ATPase (P-type)
VRLHAHPPISQHTHTHTHTQQWTDDGTYGGLTLAERTEILYQAQTAYFVALVMCQCWNLLGVARTRRVSIFTHPWNKQTLWGASAELVIVLLIVFIPFINSVFLTRPLPFVFFAFPFLFGIGLMLVMEGLKVLRGRFVGVERVLGW